MFFLLNLTGLPVDLYDSNVKRTNQISERHVVKDPGVSSVNNCSTNCEPHLEHPLQVEYFEETCTGLNFLNSQSDTCGNDI